MTLLAAHVTDGHIDLLADGLSSHAKVLWKRKSPRQVKFPGRTTLRKLFPHPNLPLAIAHCGDNQRDGSAIGVTITSFLTEIAIMAETPDQLLAEVEKRLVKGTEETFWVVGFDPRGNPFVRSAGGDDLRALDRGRYWGGSGHDGLDTDWRETASLRESAEEFLKKHQDPIGLPSFKNHFGGHWQSLTLTPGEMPVEKDRVPERGIFVSQLFPTSSRETEYQDHAESIRSQCNRLKLETKNWFNVQTITGVLERVDSGLRERIGRLVAIFDEVERDPSIATIEDAELYTGAVQETIKRLH